MMYYHRMCLPPTFETLRHLQFLCNVVHLCTRFVTARIVTIYFLFSIVWNIFPTLLSHLSLSDGVSMTPTSLWRCRCVFFTFCNSNRLIVGDKVVEDRRFNREKFLFIDLIMVFKRSSVSLSLSYENGVKPRLGRRKKQKESKKRGGINRRQHSKMLFLNARLSAFVLASICTCIVVLIVHINYHIEQAKARSVNGAKKKTLVFISEINLNGRWK